MKQIFASRFYIMTIHNATPFCFDFPHISSFLLTDLISQLKSPALLRLPGQMMRYMVSKGTTVNTVYLSCAKSWFIH